MMHLNFNGTAVLTWQGCKNSPTLVHTSFTASVILTALFRAERMRSTPIAHVRGLISEILIAHYYSDDSLSLSFCIRADG